MAHRILRRVPSMLLAVLVSALPATVCAGGSAGSGAASAHCVAPAERATVRAKKVGASVELSVRDRGWRPLTRLAKRPVGPVRSADGSHVAWVDRDFRPDGVLVIQRLADGAAFRGELNQVPKALCFAADGEALLLESADGIRSPVPLSSVPPAASPR